MKVLCGLRWRRLNIVVIGLISLILVTSFLWSESSSESHRNSSPNNRMELIAEHIVTEVIFHVNLKRI